MEKRLRSLARIVSVKDQLRRAAEWRLAELARKEEEAAADQRAIIAALNDDHPLHGYLVDAMASHLRRVSERLDAVGREKIAETERLRKETGQLRQAERMLAEAGTAHGRTAERKALAEIIEAALARGPASLP